MLDNFVEYQLQNEQLVTGGKHQPHNPECFGYHIP